MPRAMRRWTSAEAAERLGCLVTDLLEEARQGARRCQPGVQLLGGTEDRLLGAAQTVEGWALFGQPRPPEQVGRYLRVAPQRLPSVLPGSSAVPFRPEGDEGTAVGPGGAGVVVAAEQVPGARGVAHR